MIAAWVYAGLTLGVIGFQVALILGAPWGALTQGGRVDGALDGRGRALAALSIPVLVLMALAVLSASGALSAGWPPWTGWLAVAVQALSAVANWATPSAPERRLWGPITSVLLLLSVAAVFGQARPY